MRSVAAAFLVIAAGSLGASLLLIPSDRSVALMELKAKDFEEAAERYRALYEAGDRSVDVVKPLADLSLMDGDVDRAVALMEEYVAANPGRAEALMLLARYYQYDQRHDDHLATLERVNALQPSAEIRRSLAALYSFRGRYADQVRILEALAEAGEANAAELIDLAQLEAAIGDPAAAAATFARLDAIDPGAGDLTVRLLQLAVTLDAGRPAEALAAAQRWLEHHPEARTGAAPLAARLRQSGQPALAVALVEPLLAAYPGTEDLLEELVRAEAAAEHTARAFARLPGPAELPPRLVPVYIELALERGDLDAALAAATPQRLPLLPRWMLLALVERAEAAGRTEPLRALAAGLPPGLLDHAPFAAARLHLALGDRAAAEAATGRAAALVDGGERASVGDALQLIDLLRRLDREAEAFERLASLTGRPDLPQDQLPELARFLLRAGRLAEGLERLAPLRGRGADADYAWALLAGAAGRDGETGTWLAAAPDLSPDRLAEFSFIAGEGGARAAALEAARRLVAARGTPEDRLRLADALLRGGARDEAVAELRRVLDARPSPDLAAQVAQLLLDADRAAEAVAVLAPFTDQLAGDDTLLAAWVRAEAADGRPEAALARLAGRPLTGELAVARVDLALRLGRLAEAFDAAIAMGPAALPDWLLTGLAEAASAEAARAQRLLAAVPPAWLEARPLLAARLHFAAGDRAGALVRLERLPPAEAMVPAERLAAANLLLALDRTERALPLLAGLADDPATPPAALLDLARAYLRLERPAEGLARFAALRAARPLPETGLGWALLAAAAGDAPALAAWLDEAQPEPAVLGELFYAAQDRRQAAAALAVARQLAARQPGPANDRLLVEALLGAGQPREALAVARGLPGAEGRALHRTALEAAAAAGIVVAKESIAFWTARLAERGLTLAEREEAAYALVAAGAAGRILPQIAALAEAKPAEWAALHEELLAAAGDKAGLIALVSRRAATGPAEARHAAAIRLLELGAKDKAEAALRPLAEAARRIDEPPVQDLLYLWGPRPGPAQRDWLAARAAAVQGPDRAGWLRRLLDVGAADKAAQIAAPFAAAEPAVAEVYLDALLARRDRKALAAELARQVAAARDPDRLERLAAIAYGEGLRVTAREGYERLLALKPDLPEAHRRLGLLAYSDTRMPQAREHLRVYLERSGGDGETHYTYAEILRRDRQPDAARRHYETALAMLQRDSADPALAEQAERLLPLALYRTGRTEESFAGFDRQLARRPDDAHLRADYVGLLMEAGQSGRARAVLDGAPRS
ncbi:MAG TPA: tetratricopeptide repeat protein [Alphaproteobacteria bacterium]|nr:tetratricopeptide repeat protein [Alphaproteobacteria bacterium]